MICRNGCGACCIAISISSPIPGMPLGKPAGIRCINLNEYNNCKIHNTNIYPKVCKDFKATQEFCGISNSEAFNILEYMEHITK